MKNLSKSMRNLFVRPGLALAIVIGGLLASVQAVILPVDEDTSSTVAGKINPATGRAVTLSVTARQQAFLSFDLTNLPPSVTASNITSARLNLYVSSLTTAGDLTVYMVTNQWQENTANISAPGYSSIAVGTIPAADLVAKTFIEVDVTAAVTNWFNGTSNFGLAIATTSASVRLGSKEGLATGFPALLEIQTATVGASADSPGTIVLRDGTGSFSAANLTLNGALTLPPITAGNPDIIYSGSGLLLYGDNNGNFFIGQAGNSTMTGFDNTATGFEALFNNTTGSSNTANGFQSLQNNTTGSNNTASGAFALADNTSGTNNTATGVLALYSNKTGYNNTANGAQALYANTNGTYDTASGVQALFNNTTGSFNTANGYQTLYLNVSGVNNTADGYRALYHLSELTAFGGTNNIALGYLAGSSLMGNESSNIYIGNTGIPGENNTIRIGTQGVQTACYLASSLSLNGSLTLSGNDPYFTVEAATGLLLYGDYNHNYFAGNAGSSAINSLGGTQNTGIGDGALAALTSGTGNAAIGGGALGKDTMGSLNTANGLSALAHNTTGSFNTADGFWALYENTTGTYNTAIGASTLFANITGNNNTAVGYQALTNLGGGSAGGTNNIALGYKAGLSYIGIESSNIDIGNTGVLGENQTIRIGDSAIHTACYVAGISGATAASGVAVYVDASGQLGTLTSSRRYKQDIQGMDQSSEVLYSLKPVTFKYKPGIDPQGIPQFGLVAEDVEKVAPDLVAHDDQGKIYTVRYQAVDAMLLNEFLKQHRKMEEQDTEIETLKDKANKVDALEKQLNELKQMVQTLAKKK